LFAAMLERIKFDTVTILAVLDVQVKTPEQLEREEQARRARLNRALQLQHAEAAGLAALSGAAEGELPPDAPPGEGPRMAPPQVPLQRPVRSAPKVGRNQPCPCGSGKKFKNCHGVLEGVE
jgi:preprotein translocase subunit SecA